MLITSIIISLRLPGTLFQVSTALYKMCASKKERKKIKNLYSNITFDVPYDWKLKL